jgi:glyoxylase-like metal-dependent hydrolase (beta-lactamase superfamily II)
VVYSHGHADYSSGGEVFPDTAVFVAHENCRATMIGEKRPMAIAFRDFANAYMPDWIESLKRVETMEFDIFVPGHGPLGRNEGVGEFRTCAYLQDLYGGVLAQVRNGKKVDAAKQAVRLPKYESSSGYKET